MFDIGWTEMLVISAIAIIVVGPKDLPRMLRTVGQYIGKAKRMAREFQTQFDDAVRDSDLDEVRKSFEDLKSANPTGEVGKALSPLMQAADDLKSTVEESNKDEEADAASAKKDSADKTASQNAISDGAGKSGQAKASKSAKASKTPKASKTTKGKTGGGSKKSPAPASAPKSPVGEAGAAPPKDMAEVKITPPDAAEPAKKAAAANG